MFFWTFCIVELCHRNRCVTAANSCSFFRCSSCILAMYVLDGLYPYISFDMDLYGPGSEFEGYDAQDVEREVARRLIILASYTAPKNVLADHLPPGEVADEDLGFQKSQNIIDREDDYRERRLIRVLSPSRNDAFAMGDETFGSSIRTYADVMREEFFKRDEEETLRLISEKKQDEAERKAQEPAAATKSVVVLRPPPASTSAGVKRRNRWDQSQEQDATKQAKVASEWDAPDATPGPSWWSATPTPGRVGPNMYKVLASAASWDAPDATPGPSWSSATPTPGQVGPNMYEVLASAAWDAPDATPGPSWWSATPTPGRVPVDATPSVARRNRNQQFDVPKEAPGGLPFTKPEDYQCFGALSREKEEEEEEMNPEESKDRKIMKLLLEVTNGTPPQRKTALWQLTDKAREFGAGPLFNQILLLLMSPTLEDQERHLLVEVIDRVLYKLDELTVRPFVHKILVVIEPLLIDEDYDARVEGRAIISNLSKAVGLGTMIAAMEPDLDNIDEYVRNITARAFSVVASALGIPALLPFLKAVCQSENLSWQARHAGIKIVQQIALLMGSTVLPHLRSLVEIIEHGLNDANLQVRMMTARSLAALAEAATPSGIESFDSVRCSRMLAVMFIADQS